MQPPTMLVRFTYTTLLKSLKLRPVNRRASLSSSRARKSQTDLMRRGQNLPELKRTEWNQNIKHTNEPLRCIKLTGMLRKISLHSAHATILLITCCLSEDANLETEGKKPIFDLLNENSDNGHQLALLNS